MDGKGRRKGKGPVFHNESTANTRYSYFKSFFFLSEEEHTYLLVWECRLDHGSFKTVRPLELCLLP